MASCGKNSSTAPINNPNPHIDPVVVDKYLQLVNNHRMKLGLRPVEPAPLIEEVALGHSQEMAQGQVLFGHWGWRGRCAELRTRLNGNLCGEIVARGQRDHEAVFNAWLNSPHHREVIEGETYTHTGLGYIADRNGMIYWTQLFLTIE